MNYDIIIKLLKNRTSQTYSSEYEIISCVLNEKTITVDYKFDGFDMYTGVNYSDYLNEVRKLRDEKIEILLT